MLYESGDSGDSDCHDANSYHGDGNSSSDHPAAAVKLLADRIGLVPETVAAEHEDFVQFVKESMSQSAVCEVVDKLCTNQSLAGLYPQVAKLARIYKVIPPHTADWECDFSKLGIIKTCLRNRMCQKTLDSLLRISLKGTAVAEFPLDRAVQYWAKQKQRKLKT